MKIAKSLGIIKDQGEKVLKLEKVKDSENFLSFVGYKDGMALREYGLTKDEFKALIEYGKEYLNINDEPKEEAETDVKDEVVSWLVSTPSSDTNFRSALEKATADQLDEAIKQVAAKGGRNKTKLTVLKGQKDRLKPKSESKTETETESEVDFEPLDESKRPKIIPFTTKGNDASYEDCAAKLDKETELFKDSSNQYVIEAIKERCLSDADFRANVAREDKTYQGFYIFMFKAAAQGYCDRSNNVGCLDGNRAIELAFDYYNADEKAMEAEEKKKRDEEAAKRKAEAEKKKKEAKANGKTNRKKKDKTA